MDEPQRRKPVLPREVLNQIFSHYDDTPENLRTGFGAPVLNQFKRENRTKMERQTLLNVRLASRTFHDIATPKLFTILNIEFHNDSLEKAEGLVHSPRVGPHIRGIKVSMAFHSSELAYDFDEFFKSNLLVFECATGLQCELEELTEEFEKIPNGLEMPAYQREMAKYAEAKHNYPMMRAAWKDRAQVSDQKARRKMLKYQDAMREAHQKFQDRHNEQLRILYDGSFAKRVAAMYTFLPSTVPLCLDDKINFACGSRLFRDMPDVFVDHDRLVKYLAEPGAWSWSKDQWSARLLFDIPAAIHQAGAKISALQIDAFPGYNHLESLIPEPLPSQTATYHDFIEAVSELESFRYGVDPQSCVNLRLERSERERRKRRSILKYFSACIASPKLTDLHLVLETLAVSTARRGDRANIDTINLFCSLQTKKLKAVTIYNLYTDQTSMEHLVNALDADEVVMFHMFDVSIDGGRWAKTLDILRDKVMARCQAGKCMVGLDEPLGGEFDIIDLDRKLKIYDILYSETPSIWGIPSPGHLASNYVMGKIPVHPFRRDEAKELQAYAQLRRW